MDSGRGAKRKLFVGRDCLIRIKEDKLRKVNFQKAIEQIKEMYEKI